MARTRINLGRKDVPFTTRLTIVDYEALMFIGERIGVPSKGGKPNLTNAIEYAIRETKKGLLEPKIEFPVDENF